MLLRLSSRDSDTTDDVRPRVAFIVSHPIQYYVPLYQRLAQRSDLSIKVFFTWHDASTAVLDPGFREHVVWDIPLTNGYDFELVPNAASDPGMHHFFGLRNPLLVSRVLDWAPSVVHITGWAWWSHLRSIKAFHDKKIPVLFRGDSHLLDRKTSGLVWRAKQMALRHIYRWPSAFLVTGQANRAYYKAFGVEDRKLIPCPHSIDYHRFAEPDATYEDEAQRWRRSLGIEPDQTVLLFAGKFEPKKRPVEFMESVEALRNPKVVAVMVGAGEQQNQIQKIAEQYPQSFRVLPFQNQRRMPIVYRLGDLFVLPSSTNETWGLAVNEALACKRPVLVSDKVGCAADVVDETCGWVAPIDQLPAMVRQIVKDKGRLMEMRGAADTKAREFDIGKTEVALMGAISTVLRQTSHA